MSTHNSKLNNTDALPRKAILCSLPASNIDVLGWLSKQPQLGLERDVFPCSCVNQTNGKKNKDEMSLP